MLDFLSFYINTNEIYTMREHPRVYSRAATGLRFKY